MDLKLDSEKILVTGASSGLGAHFAEVIAGSGANVVLAARRLDRLDDLVAKLKDHGHQAAAVEMDVADAASVIRGVAAAQDAFGGLTGLVNNAGIVKPNPSLDVTEEEWTDVMSVNVDGVFRTAQAVARGMVEAGTGGAIVNIASILAKRVQQGIASYCASKAAVDHLTRALSLEWAKHGIRVNALAPGYFPTEINADYLASDIGDKMKKMVPMRRFGEPRELDAPLLMLLSPVAGSYITGATIPVDGGHLNNTL